MVNATVRSSLTIPEFTQALSGRITSLARTHALITKDLAQVASFDGLLGAELGPYDERGRLSPEGPKAVLPSQLAVPVGMALHELTTINGSSWPSSGHSSVFGRRSAHGAFETSTPTHVDVRFGEAGRGC